MTREWKPDDFKAGDVALIEAGCHANRRVAVRTGTPSNMGWAYSNTHNGESTQMWTADTHGSVSVVRPLVVIDPEDREHVKRLYDALDLGDGDSYWPADLIGVKAALRSLVEPPKPEEPTGKWAVVEDDRGRCLCRAAFATERPWNVLGTDAFLDWADFTAVKVLSEGQHD